MTIFIDLKLRLVNGKLRHSTFRKPINAYLYLPWCSCHSIASRVGVITTELHRLLLTSESEESCVREVHFFRNKLLDRGFPPEVFDNSVGRFPWCDRVRVLSPKPKQSTVSVVPLKLTYSHLFADLRLGSISSKHFEHMPEIVRTIYKSVVCYRSAPN